MAGMDQGGGANQGDGSRERKVKARERKTEIRRCREGRITMTTETVVTEKKHTRILADGEVYAVRVGDKWFSYFDEESRTFVTNIQHRVTRAEPTDIPKHHAHNARVV